MRYYEFYGGAGDKIHGDTIPFLDGYTALTLREPHGVVAGIIPWNYPMQILARVVGAALAMGNTLVVKPAEDASLTTIRIAELALEADVPPACSTSSPAMAALRERRCRRIRRRLRHLHRVHRHRHSDPAGCGRQQSWRHHGTWRQVAADCFRRRRHRGGAAGLVNAIIQNGGQTCSAGSRVLIERPIYERVATSLADRFSKLVAGPHDADLDLGPLINPRQRDKVAGIIAAAEAAGAKVLARGSVSKDAPSGGFYQAPVLFGSVEPDAVIAHEEVFGPVLTLFPFEDEQDAIRLANSTDYGLVAGVWTKDGARQHRVAKRVRAGQVFVNGYGAGGGIELPFGGFKKSGHGREKGFEALYDMSATKTIVFNHS
jgi:aldehyde dehydrogenase (NAD+)